MSLLPRRVDVIIADAVFGTEENYEHLEKEKIADLLKYPSYDKGQKKTFKENLFHKDNMLYSPTTDVYICPLSRWLLYKGDIIDTNKNGFKYFSRQYVCQNCQGCSFWDKCRGSSEQGSKRTLKVNRNLERHKMHLGEQIRTEQGKSRIRQRPHDVESCFEISKETHSLKEHI